MTTKKQVEEPVSNYVTIKLGYDPILVLPFQQGLDLIKCLEKAEMMVDRYNEETRIDPMDTSSLAINILSAVKYKEYKMTSFLVGQKNE